MNRNAQLYQDAKALGIASTPTQFWTAVKKSGLTPEAFVRLHNTDTKVAFDDNDSIACSYCGARFGNHHDDCPFGEE